MVWPIVIKVALLPCSCAAKDGPAVLILNALKDDECFAKEALDLARFDSFVDV
jgi:hypothetical protein